MQCQYLWWLNNHKILLNKNCYLSQFVIKDPTLEPRILFACIITSHPSRISGKPISEGLVLSFDTYGI